MTAYSPHVGRGVLALVIAAVAGIPWGRTSAEPVFKQTALVSDGTDKSAVTWFSFERPRPLPGRVEDNACESWPPSLPQGVEPELRRRQASSLRPPSDGSIGTTPSVVNSFIDPNDGK